MTESFKNPEYYIENYKNNKTTFFSLLQRVQDSFILFKQNPDDDDIEMNYRGYVDKVKNFHENEMKLDEEFKKSNKKINEGLDLMIKDIQKEKKINKNLTEKLKHVTEQDNAFGQSYSESIHEYNYTILYSTTIIGMIAFMIYSGKIKYNQ
uniref:Uncharacterized protein n=1 Tax=viral metagenome TaxID=1070528 RepID=A0A6C0EHL2_9ZZZZ